MANFDNRAIVSTPNFSRINLTYESIGTLQMGIATPVLHKTVLPGDDSTLSVDQIMRLAPLSTPVFDDVSLHFRAFFVPNRVLDPRWKEYLTAGVGLYGSNDAEIEPLSFTMRSLLSASDESRGSVVQPSATDTFAAGLGGSADWLNFHFSSYDPATGRPRVLNSTNPESSIILGYNNGSEDKFSLLPFLGIQKIYDDWYRNERLQAERLPQIINYLQNDALDERVFDLDCSQLGAAETRNPFRLFRVNYGKDRYTTALPEPVIGGDVYYPAGPEGDFNVKAGVSVSESSSSGGRVVTGSGNPPFTAFLQDANGTKGNLFVTLASSAEATIRNLKSAFKMYDFFMKDTYGGNRYVEFMQNHFNVRVPDATLDRAIYLGDHKVRVSFGEVFQTSQGSGDADTGKLGDYAGRGAAYSANGFMFTDKFLEHGQLYVIASVVPRAKYFQGIDRKFFKQDRFDEFFAEFQDIGDDALYRSELYNVGGASYAAAYEDIFGFSPRWAHLKESLDEVHGDFLQSLDSYHFGRRFGSAPVLSSEFAQIPTINDPFSYTDKYSENYLINIRWSLSSARPVKLYETF